MSGAPLIARPGQEEECLAALHRVLENLNEAARARGVVLHSNWRGEILRALSPWTATYPVKVEVTVETQHLPPGGERTRVRVYFPFASWFDEHPVPVLKPFILEPELPVSSRREMKRAVWGPLELLAALPFGGSQLGLPITSAPARPPPAHSPTMSNQEFASLMKARRR